jgi:hypothetical protein
LVREEVSAMKRLTIATLLGMLALGCEKATPTEAIVVPVLEEQHGGSGGSGETQPPDGGSNCDRDDFSGCGR